MMKLPKWLLLVSPSALYALGYALNALVMAANHGQMPVLWPGGCAGYPQDNDILHVCMDAHTHLKFLADWIVQHDGVASPGDYLEWASDVTFWPCIFIWGGMKTRKFWA